jgi:hypothetical protein
MKKAKVALARKLAVVLHRMLADGSKFMAGKANARRSRRGLREGDRILGQETTPAFPKRSPVAGTMDQVRPQDGQWHCDHAYLDWSALSSLRPHQVAAMRRPRTEARPGERMSQVEEGLTNNGPLQKPILFRRGPF